MQRLALASLSLGLLAMGCGEGATPGELAGGPDAAPEEGEASSPAYGATTTEDSASAPFWKLAGDMASARSHHGAAQISALSGVIRPVSRRPIQSPLEDEGHALVVGGYGEGGAPIASSEIYDPSAGEWREAGDLYVARADFASVAHFQPNSEDFRMFVTGGEGPDGEALSSVERFSTESDRWQLHGELAQARYAHIAELLPSGISGIPDGPEAIVVAGGSDGDEVLATSEVLYGGTRVDFLADQMREARRDHASALSGFQVFVSGGEDDEGEVLASVEVYSPPIGAGTSEVASNWSHHSDLGVARKHHTMTETPIGILVTGGIGDDGEPLASTEALVDGWLDAGDMEFARAKHTATALPDGRVLVVGGTTEEAAQPEIWDPHSTEWSLLEDAPCIGDPRFAHTATLVQVESEENPDISEPRLLVAGGAWDEGDDRERLASAELYNLEGGLVEQGDECSRDCQCEDGFCVDGYCCDSACDGACEACDLDDSEGACTVRGQGEAGEPACPDELLCDGETSTCPESCSDDAECAGDYICEDGACVPPYECEVDGDCDQGRVCEDGSCVEPAPECTIDGDCAEGEVCDDGTCVSDPREAGADAEGLLGWSCAASGPGAGGLGTALLLSLGVLMLGRGFRGRDRARGRAAAPALCAAAVAVGVVFVAAPSAAEPAGEGDEGFEAASAAGAHAPGRDTASSGPASATGGEDGLGTPAERLRVGAGVFGEGVSQNLGFELAAGFRALPWLDVGAAAAWGERPGGRLTATAEPLDLGIAKPFVQARGGFHATEDGAVPAGGGWLGAAFDLGPGTLRAGFLGEYFGNPDDFHSFAAGGMVGYEFGPSGPRSAPEPQPEIRERVVEVPADPPPPAQAIRGHIGGQDGEAIANARVELRATGDDEPIQIWEDAAEFERELDAGDYELVMGAPGYESRRQSVVVEEGETLVFYAELREEDDTPTAEVTEERIEVGQRIRFEVDRAHIREESHGILNEVGRVLEENPDLRIRVEGHTDTTGESAYNMQLSDDRAAAVVEYLTDYGIDADRLESEGFGDTQPIADNATEEGRAQNRRVQFEIIGASDAE